MARRHAFDGWQKSAVTLNDRQSKRGITCVCQLMVAELGRRHFGSFVAAQQRTSPNKNYECERTNVGENSRLSIREVLVGCGPNQEMESFCKHGRGHVPEHRKV
jgi:hypothetical protein